MELTLNEAHTITAGSPASSIDKLEKKAKTIKLVSMEGDEIAKALQYNFTKKIASTETAFIVDLKSEAVLKKYSVICEAVSEYAGSGEDLKDNAVYIYDEAEFDDVFSIIDDIKQTIAMETPYTNYQLYSIGVTIACIIVEGIRHVAFSGWKGYFLPLTPRAIKQLLTGEGIPAAMVDNIYAGMLAVMSRAEEDEHFQVSLDQPDLLFLLYSKDVFDRRKNVNQDSQNLEKEDLLTGLVEDLDTSLLVASKNNKLCDPLQVPNGILADLVNDLVTKMFNAN